MHVADARLETEEGVTLPERDWQGLPQAIGRELSYYHNED